MTSIIVSVSVEEWEIVDQRGIVFTDYTAIANVNGVSVHLNYHISN